MRYTAFVTTMILLIAPANAAVTPEIDPRASLSVVQQWIYNYRARPDYGHVPAAVRVLFHAQSFKGRRIPESTSALSPARSDRTPPRPSSSSPASFP